MRLYCTIGNDLNTLSESFNTIGVYFSKIMSQVPVPLWVPIPRNVRYNRGMSNLRSVIQRILDERRANGGHMHNDILSRILEDSDTLPALDENQIHDELRTLMLAGHETTSLALTYSAWFLSIDPDLQEELFAEIQLVTGGEPISGADVQSLTLVGNTVREAIRILPPAPIFGRENIAADVLSGYDIPAGSTIFCVL